MSMEGKSDAYWDSYVSVMVGEEEEEEEGMEEEEEDSPKS